MEYGTGVAATQLALTGTGALALAALTWAVLAGTAGPSRKRTTARAAALITGLLFVAACGAFIALAPEKNHQIKRSPTGERMTTETLTVANPDNNGVATEADLPNAWEELDTIAAELTMRGLKPLEEMDRQDKMTLLAAAVNDSLWISEGKMDPAVQEHIIATGALDRCLMETAKTAVIE